MKRLLLCISVISLLMNAGNIAVAKETSIKESIDLTLKNHKQLKSIQENRQAAVHDVRRAEGGWYPRVDTTARFGASYLSDSTTRSLNSDSNMYAANAIGVTITQPLWDGLATRNRVDMAKYQLASMDFRVIDNANSLALDALIAHADLILRRKLVAYAQENVKMHNKILTSTQERAQGGTTTMADITQIQGRLARAESQLVDAIGTLQESEITYFRLTNTNAPENLEPVHIPVSMYSSVTKCVDQAMLGNPKILSMAEDSKRAGANRELAKSAYQPTVNIELGAGTTDKRGPGSNWTEYADAMLVMRWNLYNGGADAAYEKVTAAQYRQSREDEFDMADTLNREIKNSWTRYKTALDQEKYYGMAIEYNTQTRDAFMEQFLVGQRSLLDVLDTSSELFNSSTQHETAKTNSTIASYTMFALSGGFLNMFEIDSTEFLKGTEGQNKTIK